MLFAEINPPAQVSKQTSPFQSTTIQCNHFTCFSDRYDLNPTEMTFFVVFGQLEQKNGLKYFKKSYGEKVTLTSNDLANWGTDDSVILQKIASRYSVNIVKILDETITIDALDNWTRI
jgi:hypothetical protein